MLFFIAILITIIVLLVVKYIINHSFSAGIPLWTNKSYLQIRIELDGARFLNDNTLICSRKSSFCIGSIERFPSKKTPYSIICESRDIYAKTKQYSVFSNTKICYLIDEYFVELKDKKR